MEPDELEEVGGLEVGRKGTAVERKEREAEGRSRTGFDNG